VSDESDKKGEEKAGVLRLDLSLGCGRLLYLDYAHNEAPRRI